MIGFTARTAGLRPPAVIALVRRLSELFGTSVAQHGGTVDKFLGDAVPAVFGMPHHSRGDVSSAVLGAFAMLAAGMRRFRQSADQPRGRLRRGRLTRHR